MKIKTLVLLLGVIIPASLLSQVKSGLNTKSITHKEILQKRKTTPVSIVSDHLAKANNGILYVDQSARPGGDGTETYPFQRICDALETSKKRKQDVVVEIGTGTYHENLEISNNTIIRKSPALLGRKGECTLLGYIHNSEAVTLQIEDLHIAGSDPPGAIVINNPGANTILNNVSIDNAKQYGIYQNGGKLTINNSCINSIECGILNETDLINNQEEVISYGTAIYISDAVADLSNLTLEGNAQGVIADGAYTSVQVNTMVAEKHRINPFLKTWLLNKLQFGNGFSVIEVRNGAHMTLQGVVLRDNEFCGLSVHDGGDVWAGNLTILNTSTVLCSNSEGRGGIGVSVRRGGAFFEFTAFEVGYAELCGLQIVEATAKGNGGKIHHCAIGLSIEQLPPQFNLNVLAGSLIFLDNERNLDADQMPVPDINLDF